MPAAQLHIHLRFQTHCPCHHQRHVITLPHASLPAPRAPLSPHSERAVAPCMHSNAEQASPPPDDERADMCCDGYVLCVREKQYRELLGTGSFKSVYKAFDSELGREVAWNQVRVAFLLLSLAFIKVSLSLTHSLVSIPPHLSFSSLLPSLSTPPL